MKFPFAAAACLFVLGSVTSRSGAGEVLVARGANTVWHYSDTGALPDKNWTAPDFDVAKWKSGPAPLGYGEENQGTTVSFGDDERNKPITTWFRRDVKIADVAKVETLVLNLQRDDGAVIYWNGKEVARSNMPEGAVTPQTPATDALSDDVEADLQRFVLPAKNLVQAGRNVIAVEVHQADARSSDLFFDLEVVALAPGEKPKVDVDAAIRTAMQSRDRDKAYEALLQIEPAGREYAQRIMQVARALFPPGSGRDQDERYWKLLDKARAAAPDDMEVVYAWIRSRVEARKDLPVKPAKRELPASVPKEFRFISDLPDGPPGSRRGPKILREQFLADVDDLELILENCYAYLERRGANYRGALDALRASITDDTTRGTFARGVARVLTVFGDPHSRLLEPGGESTPDLLFVMDGDRLAVLKPDRSGFVADGHPYVEKINGTPAAEWLAAAEQIVPQASPQYRRHLALRQLAALPAVARQLQKDAESFTLTLASPDGKDRREHAVDKNRGYGRRPDWPATESEVRKDGLGYLRLAQMDSGDRFIASLNNWMGKFKDTRGLIIDVRGNGGGTQDAIKTILPWLMKPGSPMKIINIAAYRLPVPLPEPNPSGFLGLYGRGLHPATSKVWAPEQAAQIRTFLSTWEPKWKLPAGKFSDWHVMVVSRETNPGAGYYDKPVIVLQNEECFSATDNFLGALKGHPNVTLMGTTSGGGSGRMADYTLPNSGLRLTLCQMASFATTGMTYDGNGVPPDVVAEPGLTDQLTGKGDSVLEATVERLGK